MKHIVILLLCLVIAGCSQEVTTVSQPASSTSSYSNTASTNERASTAVNSEQPTATASESTTPTAVDEQIAVSANNTPAAVVDDSHRTTANDSASIVIPDASTPIDSTVITTPDEYDYLLEFPSDSYPETALHIYYAIENGHSDVCTIDRDGADERRKQSLRGVDTKDGYDRDEWPMAMCAEGGEGASVAYVDPSDNRGAGSWVGHQLSAYDDGEKILFIVSKPKNLFGNSPSTDAAKSETDIEAASETKLKLDEDLISYKNCTEAHEAGVTPLFEGEPGYSKKLDRDGDGVACEL